MSYERDSKESNGIASQVLQLYLSQCIWKQPFRFNCSIHYWSVRSREPPTVRSNQGHVLGHWNWGHIWFPAMPPVWKCIPLKLYLMPSIKSNTPMWDGASLKLKVPFMYVEVLAWLGVCACVCVCLYLACRLIVVSWVHFCIFLLKTASETFLMRWCYYMDQPEWAVIYCWTSVMVQ